MDLEKLPQIRWRRIFRRKLGQAMRTESVRVDGSRWNRPCYLEGFCSAITVCICERHPVVAMRSRCCNRVACSFLKWCRSIPSYGEQTPPWRIKWWLAMCRCPACVALYLRGSNIT